MNKFFCFEKNQRFLLNFSALSPHLFLNYSQLVRFLRFFSRNLPKHWKSLLSGIGKYSQGILRKPVPICGFFGFESSFQNCFWNLFSFAGLSQIFKIRNAWNFPNSFSKNTPISFWKHSFGTLFLDILKPWCSEIYEEEDFHGHFWIFWTVFVPKWCF
jgi:hypothetical protein